MTEPVPSHAATRVALVGNPNCGKTSLFNALTGSRQKVANYPGVTVERKEGPLVTPQGRPIKLLDLPGTYSLRARSPDEEIARDVILGKVPAEEKPELLLCVADATNMRLSLRLALELRQTGIPVALILNMSDIARFRGITIDTERLSAELGMPIVTSIAVRKGGTADLLSLIDQEISRLPEKPQTTAIWSPPDRDEIATLQKEADRILSASVTHPPEKATITTRLDALLLHPVWGILILLGLLFFIFQAVFTWSQIPMDFLRSGIDFLGHQTGTLIQNDLLRSFVSNGLIGGVGAVLVFLPQILILFFFILLLEDLGYMARAAFLMDKIMGGAGLHGRAFIPLLSSFACAIPAIMATRVIDNKRDRLTTILIAPFMTCSARIPVYTLLIAAFVPAKEVWGGLELQGLVMFGLYGLGIVTALGFSVGLRKFLWKDIPPEPFLLELPDYKLPAPRSVALELLTRAKVFLQRAGTTIASMMVVIWFLASFPLPAKDVPAGTAIQSSYAAQIGKAMEPVFAPIGFNWQINIALIPGMAAREIAVASFGTLYAIEKESTGEKLSERLSHEWSLATALALFFWYAFAPQCISTLVMIRKETGSIKWMAFSFLFMSALAYTAALIAYQTGKALGWG